MDYERDGILRESDISGAMPSAARFEKGPVAVIECVQNIPCNPCVHACPFGAITVGRITDTPRLDCGKCTGCGKCVACCPGLAIFIVNKVYSADEATVSMPYEFIPVPQKGDVWAGIDRSGKAVCNARVVRVVSGEMQDGTSVITIAIPKGLAMEVRNIKRKEAD
ncbi:MAG: 4Fe-4S ferredoxin [Thermoplasmata archaeon HGW-Thermoplasmata-1]|nr:MAG: 4Fe-4S ferredoxin [Thermoplasmata archaeon HGW-Thermoplasmata-1]